MHPLPADAERVAPGESAAQAARRCCELREHLVGQGSRRGHASTKQARALASLATGFSTKFPWPGLRPERGVDSPLAWPWLALPAAPGGPARVCRLLRTPAREQPGSAVHCAGDRWCMPPASRVRAGRARLPTALLQGAGAPEARLPPPV